ncbi:MAG: restriction endonuclease [Anaerolineales bacterium]|nr:restriction endonuclease [Anaerolineales bacterium]
MYDSLEGKNQDLWIPTPDLERLLNKGLSAFSISGLPLRTRSKIIKQKICEILGYPIPETFQRTQPRFFGQLFDTYIQKSNNLQIWNEDISLSRRYVIIQISTDDIVQKVRVVTGELLSSLDKTGVFTQKYQARLSPGDSVLELVTPDDTDRLRLLFKNDSYPNSFTSSPAQNPSVKSLLPIQVIFERLKNLVGRRFHNRGHDQERNRGEQLHRLVCDALGYNNFSDDGQFPDIRHQLLEIKLQTSPTIDLGLVCPNSTDFLDIPDIEGINVRHCDVRYALFYATLNGEFITITHFFLSTGESFFSRFPQFGGKVVNKKLQIPLPKDFFD